MNYSDEQQPKDEVRHTVGAESMASVIVDAESETMPKIVPAPKRAEPDIQPEPTDTRSFSDELIKVIVKTVFVALSLIAMLSCILAFALPLMSMRICNNLGLDERAVDFGERYISRELKEYKDGNGRTADYTDERGNMPVLSATPKLTNDDFTEALYVCNRHSARLMNENLRSGNTALAEYYAERLEKYTRMYLSLNGISALSLKTDANNIASMPSPALRPVVYSYAHDMRVLNYRARAVLGKTSYMPYNTRSNTQDIMTQLTERSGKFFNSTSDTTEGRVEAMDDFVDFVDQLGAYLDVEFIKIGVENDFTKKYTITENGNTNTVTPLGEPFVRTQYRNKVLDGDEFLLFITPSREPDGFTQLYNNLGNFTQYAQWAVDNVPAGEDGLLHQLYWLRTLSSASQRLWYMEMLLYYNSEVIGQNRDAVINNYGTCISYTIVKYNDRPYQISEVYAKKLTQYIAQYQS